MNLRHLTFIGLILTLFASCVPERGKTLSDFPDATTGDSLLYYYAQIRANEYWEKATNNPELKAPEERLNFIDGIRKGIEAMRIKDDNEAYNMGVNMGVKIAERFIEFEHRYGVKFDDEILISSLIKGLEDSVDEVPMLEAQEQYYHLLRELKSKRRAELTPKVKQQLIELARDHHLSKIKNNLFYRIEKKGVGPYPASGDAIQISADYQLANGEVLGIPAEERLIMDSPGIPQVMDEAYSRLNKGSVGIFATSADALFGSRCRIMGVQPEDLVIVTITVNDIIPSGGKYHDN